MTQLTHWIPERWRETLANLRHEIIDTLERRLPGRHHNGAASPASLPVRYSEPVAAEELWSPSRFFTGGLAMDLDESDDEVVVTADLPGLDPKDFAVEVSGERLVIRGEKKHQAHHTEHGYHYSERRYGAFARALPLPCEVDANKARARYHNGVLEITLPKTEQAKARRVKVRVQS